MKGEFLYARRGLTFDLVLSVWGLFDSALMSRSVTLGAATPSPHPCLMASFHAVPQYLGNVFSFPAAPSLDLTIGFPMLYAEIST